MTLGILRGTGPFLALGNAESVEVLEHRAARRTTARLQRHQLPRLGPRPGHAPYNGRGLPAQATGRCLDALVGSLPSVLVDSDVTPTPAGPTPVPRSGSTPRSPSS